MLNNNKLTNDMRKIFTEDEAKLINESAEAHTANTNQRKIVAQLYVAKVFQMTIDELKITIQKADDSSTKLTKALNRITLTGIIIAGLSLLVAGVSVGLEYYKYFHS